MKYKGVLIVGYDSRGVIKKEVIGLYETAQSRGYLVIGSPSVGFVLEEIRVKLDGKIDQNTRIDIVAHGYLNMVGDHRINNLPTDSINTRVVLQAINECSPEPKNIHICSCFGGAAIKDIEVLTPGSFLACNASEDAVRNDIMPLSLIERLIQDPSPNNAELMFKFFGHYVGNDARFATIKRDGSVGVVKYDLDIGEILSSDRSDLLVREKFKRLFKELGPDLPEFVLTEEQRRKLESDDIEDFLSLFSSDPASAVKDVIISNLDLMIKESLPYLIRRKDGIDRLAGMTRKEINDLESHSKLRMIDIIFRYYPDIDENLLRSYLEKAINIDNALTRAIESGHANIINALIPFVTDDTDITNAITLAIDSKKNEIALKLLEQKIKIENLDGLIIDFAIRELAPAIKKENTALVGKTIKFVIAKKINITNTFDQTALIITILSDKPEIALELIKAGADFEIRDRRDNNALMYAAYKGNIEIVRKIIEIVSKIIEASVGEIIFKYKKFLGEALIIALFAEKIEVALELIEAGAVLSFNGRTAIECAKGNHIVIERINITNLKGILDRVIELRDPKYQLYGSDEVITYKLGEAHSLLESISTLGLQKLFSDEKYLNALDEVGKKILGNKDVLLRVDEGPVSSPPASGDKSGGYWVRKLVEEENRAQIEAGLGEEAALSSDSSGGAGSGCGAGCGAGRA